MDPNELLALIAGAGGGVAILGAGAWAYVRGRSKRSDGDRSSTTSQTTEQTGQASTSGQQRSTGTAVAERPAAPTWSDTLSAPSRPTAQPDADAALTAPETSASSAPSAESTVREQPDDQAQTGDAAAPVPAQTGTDAQTATPEAPSAQEPAAREATTTEPTAAEQAAEADPAQPADALLEKPEPATDRMLRLRERLSRSGALGRGLLTLLTSGSVDEGTWDEIEETLLLADLGPDATDELMENLRRRVKVLDTSDPAAVREVLREELVRIVDPELDRRLAASRRTAPDGTEVPSVILMVGVNGTGKTTTVGKLARVLVAEERSCVLGAADTFRAAAADQLATWGSRVGVDTVRSDRDGADPASVAFDAVQEGIEQEVDVVIIDTAGRLQNKKGLMDQLGKVRRVAEKGLHGDQVAEVLLVLDATTGQNGMQQARVFREAVDITGIVLTKLDGTAKGGIVVNVQRELGVPVKMVGLGEGMDDLAPFDAYGFVDALLDA
ncbi:signal recognition particle-docking protein FtsY [Brachybacterium timonense]|uniref:signal recognition particle-docking protein FtsY n=1 Tax=Brachybacterium timonense TaxID=2050896 RepID=UPI000D0B8A21|nr:signal recognition particle-docking protein FtsY [Brachybacterium timonense]